MEDFTHMNDDKDRDIIYSQSVKAGKRIYYLDVRKTKKDEMYLSITESKKIPTDDPEGKATFEKHKIFLYREDFSNFIDGLTRTIRFIHENSTTPQQVSEASRECRNPDAETSSKADDDFKIEF
ncbi:MAG: PUR family DNA/RNA-binding protein [Bacteroidaceae bacterium]|nr:PUR family DNA/RNA-binding protein [Bacteroidaceae bacterium]